MVDTGIVEKIIDCGIAMGADFTEVFAENHQNRNVKLLDGKIDSAGGGVDAGVGIRLFYGEQVLYGFTNSFAEEDLLSVTRTLGHNAGNKATSRTVPVGKIIQIDKHPSLQGLDSDLSLEDKTETLLRIDRTARNEGKESISQVSASILQRCQRVNIFNSEGVAVEETRHYTRLMISVIATEGENQAQGSETPGANCGWEFIKAIDPEEYAIMAAKRALIKVSASPCPAGEMPVIIDNGFGGVIFHEACGHALETTAVEKKASVFADKLGEAIASTCVNAVDDGTILNAWGSTAIDDEGMETQRTQLIKEGILKSFLVDKMGSIKTGFERTGSGRRQSYQFPPASRMRNTFIEGGDDTLEDMIASIDRGIYAKKMGGGSVRPGTGEFNFAVDEAYVIDKGKIAHPVKAASLTGRGDEILKNITMVGDNPVQAQGMCGSVSGSIPTNVGQPAIKVSKILVGGEEA